MAEWGDGVRLAALKEPTSNGLRLGSNCQSCAPTAMVTKSTLMGPWLTEGFGDYDFGLFTDFPCLALLLPVFICLRIDLNRFPLVIFVASKQ
jgi:hypothetical protein